MGRFNDALAQPGLGAIAEIKRRSPSAGDLRPDADPAVIAPAYAAAGAAATQPTTERERPAARVPQAHLRSETLQGTGDLRAWVAMQRIVTPVDGGDLAVYPAPGATTRTTTSPGGYGPVPRLPGRTWTWNVKCPWSRRMLRP